MLLGEYYKKPDSTLVPVQDEEIEPLVHMINGAYSYQDAYKKEPRTNPEHLRTRAATTDLYVLKNDHGIIGCVYVDAQDAALHFGLLTVDEAYRGKGYAEALMNAIEDYAKAQGFHMLQLDYMSVAKWLKTYYERYGFVETGVVVPWGTIDVIQMQKKL